jgi:hypothetical protein
MPRLACIVALMIITQGLTGCEGSSSAPSQPSLSSGPTQAAPQPSVVSLSVNVGSTGGGTPLRIVGTGLLKGATVSFAGIKVTTRTDANPGTDLFLNTPAHDPGTIDIVVTNPDGQFTRVPDAWTYVSPQTFDFNGTWAGGEDWQLGFVIRNNVLVSASCGEYTTLTFSPPVSVTGGAFSVFGDDGRGIQGRIVSADRAVGISNIPPCQFSTTWEATKLPD